MILGILAIALVGLIGYVWVTRGFFSALIHLVCTLLAGGVAFGVWEPVSRMLMDAAPTSGFLSFLEGSAYGLGLALPFAVCLAIFRVIADVILRANVKVTPVADYVGGGICGVLAGSRRWGSC
jgi:TRAP-type C4-dicarboxylate transport system permease small subunit